MFSEELTPEEDWIVQWQYGYLDGFHEALFRAICQADEENLDRLSLGFPDEVSGYKKYIRQEGWWKEVQGKIGKQAPWGGFDTFEGGRRKRSIMEQRQEYDLID